MTSSIREILHHSSEQLKEQGIPSSKREVEWLLVHLLGESRPPDLYLILDQKLTATQLQQWEKLVWQRMHGWPLAYLIGESDFYGVSLRIHPGVLIPRFETEELCHHLVTDLQGGREGRLLDLCTGSGALGIAIKRALPHIDVTLSDLSAKALLLAQENAQRNGVKVELVQGDLLSALQGERFDWVVCNPPYLSEAEYAAAKVHLGVEPERALVAGPTGLEFYERLAVELQEALLPGGSCWLEIGAAQGEEIMKIFSSDFWTDREVKKDLQGRNRFFRCIRQNLSYSL